MPSKDMTIAYTDGTSDKAYVHSPSTITDNEAIQHIINYAKTGQQNPQATVILAQQIMQLHQQVLQQRKVIERFINSITEPELQECARELLACIHEYFTTTRHSLQGFTTELITSRDAVLKHNDNSVLYSLTQNKAFIRAIAHDLTTQELQSVVKGSIKPLLKMHNNAPLWKSYITDSELASIDQSSTMLAKLQQWYQAVTSLTQQAVKLESVLLLAKYKGDMNRLQQVLKDQVPKLITTITNIYKSSLELIQAKSNTSLATIANKGLIDTKTRAKNNAINSETLTKLRQS